MPPVQMLFAGHPCVGVIPAGLTVLSAILSSGSGIP